MHGIGNAGVQSYQHQAWLYAANTLTTSTTTALFKWDTKGSGSVSANGLTWTQSGSWTGVVADSPLCTPGDTGYEWKISIDKGVYHQVGIALKGWNGKETQKKRCP